MIEKVRFGLDKTLGSKYKDVMKAPFCVKFKHWVEFDMPITIYWKKETLIEPTIIHHTLWFWDDGKCDTYEVSILKEHYQQI